MLVDDSAAASSATVDSAWTMRSHDSDVIRISQSSSASHPDVTGSHQSSPPVHDFSPMQPIFRDHDKTYTGKRKEKRREENVTR